MRTLLTIIVASFIALAGCATMPNPVPDEYLGEKSAEDVKAIDKLSSSIIAKNDEIKKMRDKIKKTGHTLEIEKGRLSILQAEKNLLLEKQKQYVLENDQSKFDENKKMIVDKDNEIVSQNTRVEYTSAFLEHTIAQEEVVEMELAVFVAELNYEKARIAKAYLLRREATIGEESKKEKKGTAETYDEQFQKYLAKQQEILAGKKDNREKSAVKLKMAEEKLKK